MQKRRREGVREGVWRKKRERWRRGRQWMKKRRKGKITLFLSSSSGKQGVANSSIAGWRDGVFP